MLETVASAVSWALAGFAGLLLIAVIVLLVEIVAATVLPPPDERLSDPHTLRPSPIAVLVPAHNEGANLLPTIADVKAQLAPGDRLLVVADNCSDDTAQVAKNAGAEVVERNDRTRIGKGYALDWGMRHLSETPPLIVIVIDADCRLEAEALERLARMSRSTGRPAQALNLMIAPDRSPSFQIPQFAWLLKNWVRPLGLAVVGLPCQLVGTGMAFPWSVIRNANLASGQIVEDLKLGLDLAAAGHPPSFCPSARISSTFPMSLESADHQRQRWEHGHIGLLLSQAPLSFGRALTSGNVGLLALSLDLAIPPLTLLGLLVVITLVLSCVTVLAGGFLAPLIISAISLAAYVSAIVVAWYAFGQNVVRIRSVTSALAYIAYKLTFYSRLATRGRVSRWIRTTRDIRPPDDS